MVWELLGGRLVEMGRGVGLHPAIYGASAAVLMAGGMALAMLWSQLNATRLAWRRERRAREEMEAYIRLDTRVGRGVDLPQVADRVCRVISTYSPFQRVAMLLRDVNGALYLAASSGMEPETMAAVEQWAAVHSEAGRQGGVRIGSRSTVTRFGNEERGVVVPLPSGRSRSMGELVVMATSVLDVQRRSAEEAVIALEVLGTKLGRSIEAVEMSERLLKAEKLASLGVMAGGIAHTLNNPLTVVMGYAELMGEISRERMVLHSADAILAEARKMRETVESLQHFWRPPARSEEGVDLCVLVKALAKDCEQKLVERRIGLELQLPDESISTVRGNSSRLRFVLEHLMNNAEQAIAVSRATTSKKSERAWQDTIRLTVSEEEGGVQMIVSDTGTGFSEPERVFDPFYTTQGVDEGNGLGLSICYGIVREHGGEISAFNLHPSGAAIVVELPVVEVLRSELESVCNIAQAS